MRRGVNRLLGRARPGEADAAAGPPRARRGWALALLQLLLAFVAACLLLAAVRATASPGITPPLNAPQLAQRGAASPPDPSLLSGTAARAATLPAPRAAVSAAAASSPPPPPAPPASPPPLAGLAALGPVFHFNGSGQPSPPPPPPFPPGERVLIATRTGHFFGAYERVVPDCDVHCEFRSQGPEGADALWYHAPSACGMTPERAFKDQVAVVMSMESAANYGCLDDPAYMAQFDLEMTYRLRAHIPLPYLRRGHVEDFAKPIVSFENKKNAVVYIQSNCGARSGRDAILRAVSKLGVALEARGPCLNNAPLVPREASKTDAMRDYLFCATMENSLVNDYVSEKMWDGMAAGCLPIYYGAPNIQDHLPAANAVVDYLGLGGTPEALAAELKRLAGDKAAYEARMAWRTAPLEALGEGYRRLEADTRAEHSQCRLCKLVSILRRERREAAAAAAQA